MKQVIVTIKNLDIKKKIIKVVLAEDFRNILSFKDLEEENLTKMDLENSICPGTFVQCKVLKVMTNGVLVKFLKIFIGYIHIDHL